MVFCFFDVLWFHLSLRISFYLGEVNLITILTDRDFGVYWTFPREVDFDKEKILFFLLILILNKFYIFPTNITCSYNHNNVPDPFYLNRKATCVTTLRLTTINKKRIKKNTFNEINNVHVHGNLFFLGGGIPPLAQLINHLLTDFYFIYSRKRLRLTCRFLRPDSVLWVETLWFWCPPRFIAPSYNI